MLDAQVDVPHRPNSSGALAKSRFPRTVPATQAVLSTYADYQIERMEILGDADCDMVFVALYHENRWVRRSHNRAHSGALRGWPPTAALRYGRICPAIIRRPGTGCSAVNLGVYNRFWPRCVGLDRN